MFNQNKKVGEGYYYLVYDIGNGRVLKKQKRKFRFFLYILYINKTNLQGVSEYKSARRNIINIWPIYEKLVELIPDISIIGNPIFIDGINYTQDNATQLKDVLPNKPDAESINLLEQFIKIIKELWKYGCHEKSLNFFTNFGLSRDGKVILIDFNEITFNKTDVIADVEKMKWLNNWSYINLPERLQHYYRKRLKEEFTVANIEELWNSYNHSSSIKHDL